MIKKVLFTWSAGKDSAIALYELQKVYHYKILALLTTITDVKEQNLAFKSI
jgi:diphthamide synthase (EF-2-diphthine--ammonia ligase)